MPKQVFEARVVEGYNMGSVIAFSGYEYIRSEWRPVPAGFEEHAQNHELLEVRQVKSAVEATPKKPEASTRLPSQETEAVELDMPPREEAPEEEVQTSTRKRRSRKTTDESEE